MKIGNSVKLNETSFIPISLGEGLTHVTIRYFRPPHPPKKKTFQTGKILKTKHYAKLTLLSTCSWGKWC